MKHRTLPALIAALSVAIPALSMAQPQDRDDRRPDRGDETRRGPDGPRHDEPAPRHESRDDRRDNDHRDVRGAGPNHDFRQGGRLPRNYRDRQYVVDDWRGHHLKSPPRGYHWVQTGADYVLVAIATGIIAQVILGQ
jgi:Ni/Co efflux regulator RcnB